MKNTTLTEDQIRIIECDREADFNGYHYTYKDYLYKSEIREDGTLIIRINNRLPVLDPNRIEYV